MTIASSQNEKTLKIRISSGLRQKIIGGVYPPGATLPSQRELCEEFGVSRMTVRGALDVLEKDGLIRRHIRRSAVVTGAKAAASASTHHCKLNFLFVRWSLSPNVCTTLMGFEQGCRELGVHLKIYDAHETKQSLLDCLENVPHDTDGMCLEPFNSPEELRAIEALVNKGIAVVTTVPPPASSSVSSVTLDNFTGAFLATDHLLRRWARPVYHLGGSQDLASAQRLMGWQAAMIEHAFADWQDYLFEEAGDPCEQLYCGRNYDPAKFGYQAAGQLFDDHERGKGPYSIFTVNDHDARGVYQAAKEHGLEVGTDVHVVGFGNYAFAGKLNPALSTIATEENDGYAAAKLLWHIRQARPAKPIRQVLAARLIERASSLGLDGGRAPAGNDSRSASPLPAHV